MNLQEIRNIKEDEKFLINGIEYVCIMASGFAIHPNKTFRFTNMALPKKIRHSVYNELYYPCELLFEEIQNNKITFNSISGKFLENTQLSLF